MEIICDYFNEGYTVLYNLGDDDLRNTHNNRKDKRVGIRK